MESAPFFAVVIPTLNRGRMLVSAVRSVLAQTERSLECWVVDGGSSDDTRARMEAIADPRLRCIWNETRVGSWCRNQAIRATGSPWIAFVDDDDAWLPEHLATLRAAIAGRPSVGFWFTNAYLYRYRRVVGTLFDPARPIPEGKVPGYYAVGDSRLPYVTSCAAIRRDAFERTGLYREDLRTLEDTELYARMFRDGLEVGAIRQPTLVRRIHDTQATQLHFGDGRFDQAFNQTLLAGGPPPDEERRLRLRTYNEIAGYLTKAGDPAAARRFLRQELGDEAARQPGYKRTFVPAPALKLAKALRGLALRARYHPAWAPRDYARAGDAVRPYFDAE